MPISKRYREMKRAVAQCDDSYAANENFDMKKKKINRSTGALVAIFASNAGMVFAQSNSLNTTGNVGVGTTTPNARFEISTPSSPSGRVRSFAAIHLLNNTLQLDQFGATHVSRPQWNIFSASSDGQGLGLVVDTQSAIDAGTSLKGLFIKSGGNVGIGTLNPTRKLHIADSGYIQFDPSDGAIEIGSGNDGNSYIDFKGGGHLEEDYWGRLGYKDSEGFSLTSRATNAAVLATRTADISNYMVMFSGAAANSYGELSFEGTGTYSGNFYVGGAATGAIVLRNSGYTPRLWITPSGDVGVGTTSPSHKLSVNGSVRAKEVIVETTGWSDYVFAGSYKLPTLAETEEHIVRHGHLPGIPSAADVAENGVSLGEMQAKLLAKIEEMTLHQIAMEKRLRAVEEENQALRSELAGAGIR